jgi:predicted permease
VIALGWGLARQGFLSASALHDINRLTYWVGLPSLLFYRIAGASHEMGAVAGLLAVSVTATVLSIGVAWLTTGLLALPKSSRGTFVQGVFRGNLIFIGLPVVLYAFSASETTSGNAEASALLVFGPMVVLYNVLGVVVLLYGGSDAGRAGVLRSATYGLITNPILIACLGGLVSSLAMLELPAMAERTFSALGQMALPLALICIGGTLHTARIRGSLALAAAASTLKVFVVPAVGFLLALWIGLTAEHTRIALILLACPTASATYVLARQLNGDEPLASSIIVVSTLMAVPAMVAVLVATR